VVDPLRIDTHLHLYETKEAGQAEKEVYEIWEYGPSHGVAFAAHSGDISDAEAAMTEAGYAHAVIVNLFAQVLLSPELRSAEPHAQAGRLMAFNEWACALAAARPQFSVFVAVDPTVLGGEAGAAHLRAMVEHHGAKGVKIHPVLQKFMPDDIRMHPIYRTCVEMGLPVLSHAGLSRDGVAWAEPASFAPLLRSFPDLNLVLAHLGGGAWRQTAEFARSFPRVVFDLCEIIAWVGAPNAPSQDEMTRLILEIGPERVMLGSDFPWYGLGATAEQVMDLPLLGSDVKAAILGANAARILRLPH
jgi:uncharacterized protein